ncbi:glycine transaminase, partial [Sarracenia purpurea var. burkii]
RASIAGRLSHLAQKHSSVPENDAHFPKIPPFDYPPPPFTGSSAAEILQKRKYRLSPPMLCFYTKPPCVFVRASARFKLAAACPRVAVLLVARINAHFCLLQNQCSFLLVTVLAAAWVFAVADMRLDAMNYALPNVPLAKIACNEDHWHISLHTARP